MSRARPSANIAGSSRLTSSAATVQDASSAAKMPQGAHVAVGAGSRRRRAHHRDAPAATNPASAGAQISIE